MWYALQTEGVADDLLRMARTEADFHTIFMDFWCFQCLVSFSTGRHSAVSEYAHDTCSKLKSVYDTQIRPDSVESHLFQTIERLTDMDFSQEEGLLNFLHLVQSLTSSEQPFSITQIAIATEKGDNVKSQEMKIYANLVLIIVSCRSFTVCRKSYSQASSGVRSDDRIDRTIRTLKLDTTRQRTCERKKVTKHAMHLLDAFDRLCALESSVTAASWVRLTWAMFAASLIEIAKSDYEKLELENVSRALTQFEANLQKIKRQDLVRSSFADIDDGQKDSQNDPMPENERQQTRSTLSPDKPACFTGQRSIGAGESGDKTISPLPQSQALSASPYKTRAELSALQAYMDLTANMMNRSSKAPYIWGTLIPQLAWGYPCVRYALIASAETSKAVLGYEPDLRGVRKDSSLKCLRWTNQAILAVKTGNPPGNAVLLMSLLLGCIELFCGRSKSAFMHLRYGSRITEALRLASNRDELIRAYCRAFTSTLVDTQDTTIRSASNKTARLAQSVASLQLSLSMLDQMLPRVHCSQIFEKEKILRVMGYSQSEIKWLLLRWRRKLAIKPDLAKHLARRANIGELQAYLPWAKPLNQLQRHLENGEVFDVVSFEIAMERTMPFFALSRCDEADNLRQDVAELMMRGPALRGKSTSDYNEPLY